MTEVTRNKDAEFKVLLDSCNVCNMGLIDAVDERVQAGESVNAACKHYERHQEQLHGEAAYSADALRGRYNNAKGLREPNKPKVEPVPSEKAVQMMIVASREQDAMIQKTKVKEAKAMRKGADNLTIETELMDRFAMAVKAVQEVLFAMIQFKLGRWTQVAGIFHQGWKDAKAQKGKKNGK